VLVWKTHPHSALAAGHVPDPGPAGAASQAAEQRALSKRGLPQLRLEQVGVRSGAFSSRRAAERAAVWWLIEAVEAMAEGAATPLKTLEEQERGVCESCSARRRSACSPPFPLPLPADSPSPARMPRRWPGLLDRLDPAQSSQPDPDPPALHGFWPPALPRPACTIASRCEPWPEGWPIRLAGGTPAPIEGPRPGPRPLRGPGPRPAALAAETWWQVAALASVTTGPFGSEAHRAALRVQASGVVQPRLGLGRWPC